MQQLCGGGAAGLGGEREEQMLGADELVLQALGLGLPPTSAIRFMRGDKRRSAAVGLGQAVQQRARVARDRADRGSASAGSRGRSRRLLDERDEQMLRRRSRRDSPGWPGSARSTTASWAFSVNLLMFMVMPGQAAALCVRGASRQLGQRFVVRALLSGQLRRQLDVDTRVQVALSRRPCRPPASRSPSAGTPGRSA